MPDFEILIKTRADLEGAKATSGELDKLAGKSTEAAKATDHLVGEQSKLLRGIKAAGQELPLARIAINALQNVWTLAGVAIALAITGIRKAINDLKGEHVDMIASAERVAQVSVAAHSQAEEAAKAYRDVLKDIAALTASANTNLESEIQLIEEKASATIRLLDGQKELDLAVAKRDIKDPVALARKEAEIEQAHLLRTIALAPKGQQAALVEKQAEQERLNQRQLGEEVPKREDVMVAVNRVEADRLEFETAQSESKKAFVRRDILKRAAAVAKGEDLDNFFKGREVAMLMEAGVVNGYIAKDDGAKLGFDAAKLPSLIQAAEVAASTTKERTRRARAAFRSSVGTLPRGVATAVDVEPFVSGAEADAAQLQNESYLREKQLEQKARLLRAGHETDAAVGFTRVRIAGVRGQTSVNQAERAQNDARDRQVGELVREIRGGGGHDQNWDELKRLIKALIENQKDFKNRDIADLWHEIENVNNRSRNSR